MRNCRRIWTGWTAAALALCAGLARADDQRVVSLTCRGTEVRKAISMLQTVSDLRVVIDPRVQPKRITLSLKDLPPEDALKTVVTAAGLSFRKLGNAYVVEPKGSTPPPAPKQEAGSAAHDALGMPPGLAGGIVHPNGPAAVPAIGAGITRERQTPVAVAPEVLEALERTVEVDVKNGPMSAVTEQLSRSAGVKVSADPARSEGLVATVVLHGIPLKAALELVAGQTGLQISPRPDGVAFVAPGFSLDAEQTRARSVPAGARRVEQGQLWTAEWANVLTSGIATAAEAPASHSLRRHSGGPDGRPLQLKPRSGPLGQLTPAAAPAPAAKAARLTPKPSEASARAKASAAALKQKDKRLQRESVHPLRGYPAAKTQKE